MPFHARVEPSDTEKTLWRGVVRYDKDVIFETDRVKINKDDPGRYQAWDDIGKLMCAWLDEHHPDWQRDYESSANRDKA